MNILKLIDVAQKRDSLQKTLNEITQQEKSVINFTYEKEYDIGIITATHDEFEAVKNVLQEVVEVILENNDSVIYFKGIVKNSKRDLVVILPYPQNMGMTSTSSITTKLLLFNPKIVFMIGIAAGNKNTTKIGDILIADQSIDYNEVVDIKKKDGNTSVKFMQNANSINTQLKTKLGITSKQKSILKTIKEEYRNSSKISNDLKCHIGLIVTGSSLLRNQDKFDNIISSYHGVIGLDMETHAVYYTCCNNFKDKNPLFVSIKSVSDFGDNDSNSHALSAFERKEYALHTSTNFFKYFVESILEI
jgi:nucleoside phosphorylase